MPSILIIDDEDNYLELCRRYMPEHSFLPPARNYRETAAALRRYAGQVDLVLLDVHFNIPDAELLPHDKQPLLARGGDPAKVFERLRRSQGLYILDQIRQSHPDLPVIVMTSRDDLPLEADAERLRAEDYTYLLADDYLDARALKLQIDGILAQRERHVAAASEPFYWGNSAAMIGLRRRLGILARGRLPVIIQGATGTGKSLVAREFIHPRSERAGPFVAVDLSTLPNDLMAAHLFGVVKGAYTGATSSREGVLARAHGGTLFLDEIGNLGLELQKSLLLVLQEGTYRPIGATKELQTDIKLVVATNENLAAMVRAGRFREDLYMRLNPATAVTLPGLRERRDDFQELLEWFMRRVTAEAYNRDLLAQYALQRGLPAPGPNDNLAVTVGRSIPPRGDARRMHVLLHPSSFKLLQEFDWPGNFRQFEMTLSNLLTFTLVDLVDRPERIEPEDLGEAGRPDIIPILPRTVSDLLRPMTAPAASEAPVEEVAADGADLARLAIVVRPGESLNAVSCAVERQYLEHLYERCLGDLGKMGEILLNDAGAGRKIQLRMNQLGIKLRRLKRRADG
ncbi:DNA-binding transcriptional response regulator, NtrC family, contains REC, AAA-type ATPase, and a Fis-type DNA-binding domains [Nannocystis exedens]|uniref:DNA-binding transcriptional response regulator, NtrC family, contains REC, AAA-type ATPase, and a Fis-type DNA-binding domains n=1 Tax=Nannocystis exedens TaxID=54 RepID=A0A1I1W8W8_9BACT|nr:sigma 54-interacting transcriptional regulator [Nannocystis exedens]PCC67527.1 two component, sigma54 specific, transcriptional regulator, Fis family protein [Nannocystis exedens]SFD91449.1 DNA-binding transcriptional response regulator, NtrC family, contains REC, AAA-type ATPase, and a Fis-type DNA-binding domains [Nannocystis exedens]